MNMPAWVISSPVETVRFLARPRSMIFTWWRPRRSRVIIRLSGERSRWITPAAWIASRPRRAWMPSSTASATGKGPLVFSQWPTSSPSMCSQTM